MINKYAPIAFASVLAVSSVASVAMFKSVRVSADVGEIAGITDFVDSAFSSTASPAWNVNGYAAYIAALWAIHTALENPVHTGGNWDASSITAIEGKYNYNGDLYPCVSSSVGNNFSPSDGGVNCCRSPHFNIYTVCAGADRMAAGYSAGGSYVALRWMYYGSTTSVTINANSSILSDYSTTNLSNNTINAEFTTFSVYPRIQDGESVWRYFTFNTPAAIAKLGSSFTLPSGSLTSGSINSYILDTLNPYIVNQYPEVEPYVYTPYVPEYPTDFVTGIPKEWTVENPQLPDIGKKHLVIPEFSWDSLDLSGLQEVSHGVGFWWALLGKIFTDFHLFPIAILVVALSVVGFILWKLGG